MREDKQLMLTMRRCSASGIDFARRCIFLYHSVTRVSISSGSSPCTLPNSQSSERTLSSEAMDQREAHGSCSVASSAIWGHSDSSHLQLGVDRRKRVSKGGSGAGGGSEEDGPEGGAGLVLLGQL